MKRNTSKLLLFWVAFIIAVALTCIFAIFPFIERVIGAVQSALE